MQRRGVLGVIGALALSPAISLAEDYPAGPITVIVPYPAGGVTDLAARLMAGPMGERLGQPVLVENVPGATGSVGATTAARAAPDGYTLFYGSSGNLALNTITMKGLDYDPVTDFTPLQATWASPLVLVVHPDKPYRTLDDFVAYAQAHPGEITFGSAGVGSNGHLAGEQFQMAWSVGLLHVPYQGTSQEVVDLVAGRIDAAFEYSSVVQEYTKSGQLVPLATTGQARMTGYEDVPTVGEAGHPEATTTAWSGYLVPAGTPQPIVDRLAEVVHEVLALPEVVEFYQSHGSIPLGDVSREKFAQFIADETASFRAVIESAGITFD